MTQGYAPCPRCDGNNIMISHNDELEHWIDSFIVSCIDCNHFQIFYRSMEDTRREWNSKYMISKIVDKKRKEK